MNHQDLHTIKQIRLLGKVLFFFLLLSHVSCVEKNEVTQMTGNPEEIVISFYLETGSMTSRANITTESIIQQLDILVFENGLYSYRLSPLGLGQTYIARFEPSEEPVNIYLLANARSVLDTTSLVVNSTLADVREQVTMAFTEEGFEDFLPMAGEYEFAQLNSTTSQDITVRMLRSVASVIIQLNDSTELLEKFQLTSALIYRANNEIQLIPDEFVLNTVENKITVIAPSIPSSSQHTIMTLPVTNVTGNTISGIYLPEAQGYTTENEVIYETTTIIVGGIYGDSNTETFYRINFRNQSNNQIGQVLRNHRYLVTIMDVTGEGEGTPGEAGEKAEVNIITDVIEWNEGDDTNIIYGPDGNYFGSPSVVRLAYFVTATRTIPVTTNMDNFTIQWLTATGELTGDAVGKGEGEATNDIFSAYITDDGKSIVFTALINNLARLEQERKLLITAGSIQLTVTVIQETSDAHAYDYINIFSYTGLLGNLGDDVMNINVSGPDPQTAIELREVINDKNLFGPGGKVAFGGFYISGLAFQVGMNMPLAELFDVILIPNGAELIIGETEAGILTSWLQTSTNRVLMTYINNTTLINHLGNVSQTITFDLTNPTQQRFLVPADAPDFILHGPFGSVPANITAPLSSPNAGLQILDSQNSANSEVQPILVNEYRPTEIVIGINTARRIIYLADPYLFDESTGLFTGSAGVETNPADIMLANMITWIAETVIGDDLAQDL